MKEIVYKVMKEVPKRKCDRRKGQGERRPGSYGEARAESGCLRGGPIGTSGRSPGLSISLIPFGHRSGFQGVRPSFLRFLMHRMGYIDGFCAGDPTIPYISEALFVVA